MSDLSDRITMVVGASRGLGHGIAAAFADAGAPVIALARNAPTFPAHAGIDIRSEIGDATDTAAAEPDLGDVLGQLEHRRPRRLRMAQGGTAQAAPPGQQGVRDQQRRALAGSPLSGGYAGAKATQRFITSYAHDGAQRARLDIRFTAVLPRITALTDLGRPAVQAYADRNCQTVDEYLAPMGPPLTPEIAGAALVELVRGGGEALGYLLTGNGLQQLP